MAYISKITPLGNSNTYDISAVAVKITDTTPSSAKSYYLTYVLGKTEGNNYALLANNDLYYYDTGTSSYLNVGSSSNSGGLTLHNSNGTYGDIATSAFSSNRTFTLPDKTGTFALMNDIAWSSIGSALPDAAELNNYNKTNNSLGLYYSGSSTKTATLSHPPFTGSGFRFISLAGYGDTRGHQIAWGTSATPYLRTETGTANTYTAWSKLVYIQNDSNNANVAIGSSSQPVYTNSDGKLIAATAYSGLLTSFTSSTNTLSITVGGTTKTASAINSVSNTWTAGKTAGPTIKTTVNGVAGTAVAIPSASASASGVVTTGDQTFAGIKTFTSPETINTTGNGAQVNFKFSNAASANGIYGQNWITYENTSGRFYWREWSGSSSGRTSYFEQYRLPACDANRTSSPTYNIITTKNPADLGYYLPLSGGQMTGPLTWKDGNALPEFSGNPPFLLGIESFANGGTTKWKTISSITVGGATKDGDGNTISSTYLKLSGGQMTGAIGFGAASMNRAILYYNSTYPKYGIWYNDASVDTMRFSASGNADTNAGADLCINGNGDGTVTIRGATILTTSNYSTTCDGRYVKKAGDTMTGHLTAPSTACSWISGQNAANAAFNIGNATNTDSYWPWMRQTNTSSAKWFSFGTLGTKFYWIGSATSRTGNGYDYGMSFDVANGYLQGCSRVYGAVWNDYAEYRKDNPNENQESGRCVKELGDGSLGLTTKRLERGCEIVSDTFGFAIGQDEKNGYNTPIASNGRVLAYPYESIEEFRTHIGWPICSGPNGTVSIMSEEEEEKYPSRIIGTISEIPSYDTWGTGNVKVNGRVWIRIR